MSITTSETTPWYDSILFVPTCVLLLNNTYLIKALLHRQSGMSGLSLPPSSFIHTQLSLSPKWPYQNVPRLSYNPCLEPVMKPVPRFLDLFELLPYTTSAACIDVLFSYGTLKRLESPSGKEASCWDSPVSLSNPFLAINPTSLSEPLSFHTI